MLYINCIMNEATQVFVILTGLCPTSGLGNTCSSLTHIHLQSPLSQCPVQKSRWAHLISGLSICHGGAFVNDQDENHFGVFFFFFPQHLRRVLDNLALTVT